MSNKLENEMDGKHSPGSWSRNQFGELVDANGERVHFRGVSTLAASSPGRIDRAEANTVPAEAAPRLLAALGALIVHAGDQLEVGGVAGFEALLSARAAIANATGDAS